MTEPPPPQPPVDTSSAILVAVTQINGKLDTALAVQAIHSTDITELKRVQSEQGNRLTAVETLQSSSETNSQRNSSARSLAWNAIGAIGCVGSVVLAVLLAVRGG